MRLTGPIIQSRVYEKLCKGVSPLSPRIEPWMDQVLTHSTLNKLIDSYGSPLNVQRTAPFIENVTALKQVAKDRELSFKVFFARKSNKCISYLKAAMDAEAGVDTASIVEVQQALDAGINGHDVVCTAAIKPRALIELCVRHNVTIILDNDDEIDLVLAVSRHLGLQAIVGIRLAGFAHDGNVLHSRFGFAIHDANQIINRLLKEKNEVNLIGLHFHLNGYDASQRVSALNQCLPLVSKFKASTSSKIFIDIGGGFPMSYLKTPSQLDTWNLRHIDALMGLGAEITRDNHALGRTVDGSEVIGQVDSYPTAQALVQDKWLATILDSKLGNRTVESELREVGVELRCEPGRSVLDGCGFTVAQVAFRKQDTKGDWIIGLNMNRTQNRTGFLEFLLDPILVPHPDRNISSPAIEGYLAGTYCTESEWISRRKFHFSSGVDLGDLLVFPNTAGYLMHFLESQSHQFALANNIFIQSDNGELKAVLDEIDNVT